jgi:NitT/TauT family transport system ATP-binding protein
MPSLIELNHVEKRFSTGTLALQDLSLSVGAGEFVSLLGPSGCGKSTVLRLIAGLEHPSAGRMQVDNAAPGSAKMSYVFQEPTLMPWSKVFDNVWLPLRLAGQSREQARGRVEAMLERVGLTSFAAAYPRELSGGMRMRVSIARALVSEPRVLLMDEPFAALDEITRERLNDELLIWAKALSLTTIFVTHSVFEAVYLSRRVIVMSPRPGRIAADLAIDEPWPRSEAFRSTARYAELCAGVSQRLRTAMVAA